EEVPRASIYEVVLVPSSGARPVVLATQRLVGSVPTRLVYRVAPGGRWLAYRGGRGELRLRGPDCVRCKGGELVLSRASGDFSFDPDGRAIAFDSDGDLVVQRLDSGEQREVAETGTIERIEWTAAGILILRQVGYWEDGVVGRGGYNVSRELTLYPLG